MRNLSQLYNLAHRPNRPREQAGMMAETMRAMPTDRYGYSAIAKIPMMALMGKYMGKAATFEEQRSQEALTAIQDLEERERIAEQDSKRKEGVTEFMNTFQRLAANPLTQGVAIELWNEQAPNILGINRKIDAVEVTPKIKAVHFQDGLWWGIDESTGNILVSTFDNKGWRIPTEEDQAFFQSEDTKFAEGAKAEIIERAKRDLFKKRPDLIGAPDDIILQELDPGVKEKLGLIDIYARGGTPGGKRIKEIISPKPTKRIEEIIPLGDKVKVYYTDGTTKILEKTKLPDPPKQPEKPTVARMEAEIIGKFLKGAPLTPQEQIIFNNKIKDRAFNQALQIVRSDIRSMAMTDEEIYLQAEALAEKIRRQKKGGTTPRTTDIPEGAVFVGKHRTTGKPVYRLPDGRLWTPGK